jgi:hypothetical protein
MRHELAFRLSGYLTLAMACVCLSVAEMPFIPGMVVFLGVVLGLMAIAFAIEGRWSLPAWGANLLALVITLGAILWFRDRLARSGDPTLRDLPAPVQLLPYVGPLLMILLLAKLFRPKRRADYWGLQALGLTQVALGCTLAGEPIFGLLLVVYLTFGLWHLLVFYLSRESWSAAQTRQPHAGKELVWPGTRLAVWPMLWRSALWSAVIVSLGLPFYLFLPRQGENAWNPFSSRTNRKSGSTVGYSSDIDLNRTGPIEVDNGVAMEVHADDGVNPCLDLSHDQLWRGTIVDFYRDGHWAGDPIAWGRNLRQTQGLMGGPNAQRAAMDFRRMAPRNIGPWDRPTVAEAGRCFLTFKLRHQTAGGIFLAEPVPLDDESLPVAFWLRKNEGPEIVYEPLSNLLLPMQEQGSPDYHYYQVALLRPEDASRPAVTVFPQYHFRHLLQSLPELQPWTRDLLRRLAASGKYGVTPADLSADSKPDQLLQSPAAEKIAVALTQYLGSSGEYTYTLDRPRVDLNLDPTLDFLFNVKQGHCDLYAASLALMLRTQGVPTRLVKGFRGIESRGEGDYYIRQRFAHTWVEALLPRPGPRDQIEWYWKTLDPTASVSAPPAPAFSLARWWDDRVISMRQFWHNLILNYQGDMQDALLNDTGDTLTAGAFSRRFGNGPVWGWLVLCLVVGTVLTALWLFGKLLRWLWRRLPGRRTAASRAVSVACYARLLRILKRRGQLQPASTQTPQEFARQARRKLQGTVAPTLAEVPERVVTVYYRTRFGEEPLSDAEDRDLHEQLDRLETALIQAP